MAASQDQQTSASQNQQGGGTQWYIRWAHTGSSATSGWHGALDGPFAANAAPVGGAITIGGQTYPAITGPYNTASEATAFLSSHPKGPGSESSTSINVPSVPNPLAGLLEIGHWIGELVTHLTDIYMWRSLGWLALGLVLLVVGVLLLLRKEDLIPNAVPVPVPV